MRVHVYVCVQRISVALKRLQEAYCVGIGMRTHAQTVKPEGSYVGTCINARINKSYTSYV